MKLFSIKYVLLSLAAGLVFAIGAHAQVGVGTVQPEGILDVESSTQGIVFPRVVLTSTALEAPVINPNGASLVAGTVVYNTTASNTGTNDVYPGIYAWDGTKWTPQFILEEYEIYEQTGGCLRTIIREGTSDPDTGNVATIPMNGSNSNIFTPTYTGTYRIEVKANFAAGEIDPFTTSDDISLATSEGAFFFSLNGPGIDIDPTSTFYDYAEGWLYCHSYSSYSDIESPALVHDKVPHYGTLVFHEDLAAGQNYTFTLTNSINTGHDYFVNNGDSGTGQGHIGHDVPCTIEFTLLQE